MQDVEGLSFHRDGGIATMTLVAYYISWSKRQDKPLPKAPAPPKPAASAA